jgi:Domain of unknown function (DUF4292)
MTRFINVSLIFLLLCVFYSSGCKKEKRGRGNNAAATGIATEVKPSAYLREKLSATPLAGVRTLKGSAKVYTESQGMAVNASANVVWVRDSLVWINVKKLGLEAVRALVTPDSAWVLNRLDKTCLTLSVADFCTRYGIPGDGFSALQDMLLGSATLLPNMPLQSGIQDSLHRLYGSNDNLIVDYRMEEGTFLLKNESFIERKRTNALSIAFDKYNKLTDMALFPYLRRVEAFGADNGKSYFELEFTAMEVNSAPSWKFDIPSHYQRIGK